MEERLQQGPFGALSADQLVHTHCQSKPFSLPSVGTKRNQSGGSDDSDIVVHQVEAVVGQPRVAQLSHLSQAQWLPECRLAKVTRVSGKHFSTMGHTVDSQLYLHPEEALFLMEAGRLDLAYLEVAMSLQQAYHVLLGSECSLNQYIAYATLVRLGYTLVRHHPPQARMQKRPGTTEPALEPAAKTPRAQWDAAKDPVKPSGHPLEALWTGGTVPRVDPASKYTTDTILQRIALRCTSSRRAAVPGGQPYQIAYDVYAPGSKPTSGRPRFRMVVCQPDDLVPMHADLIGTSGGSSPEAGLATLLFAFVSRAAKASFFSLAPVQLPDST